MNQDVMTFFSHDFFGCVLNIQLKTKSNQTDSLEVDRLIEQRMILRILQPDLQKQIEDSIENDPELASFVVYYDGKLYLSLESIADREEREQIYSIIQSFQIDDSASLNRVPANFRAFLHAAKNRQRRFIGAVAMGALSGIVLGLMGMAIGVLVLSITGLADNVAGMAITAVTFVACCAVGWFMATYYLLRIRPLPTWRQ
jgi:hypothetical protein